MYARVWRGRGWVLRITPLFLGLINVVIIVLFLLQQSIEQCCIDFVYFNLALLLILYQ